MKCTILELFNLIVERRENIDYYQDDCILEISYDGNREERKKKKLKNRMVLINIDLLHHKQYKMQQVLMLK